MNRSPLARAVVGSVLTTSLLAGGCAKTLEMVAGTQDSGMLNPDSVQAKRPGWGKPPPPTTPADRLRGDDPDGCKLPADAYKFYCAQRASESDPMQPTEAKRYVLAGLTLSNELCDAWFTRLQVTQVTLKQTADAVSNLGSLSSAILGYADASAEDIGLVASFFGSGKEALDNVAANYIVAADLPAVAAAVTEFRAHYAAEIDSSTAAWNYYSARRVIMAYDNTCSALFVKRFVNARVVDDGKADGVAKLFDAAVSRFAGQSATYFPKVVSVSQLITIYAVGLDPNTPDAVRAELMKQLVAAELADDKGIKFKDGKDLGDLRNGIIAANIDSALAERSGTRTKEIRSILTAAVAAEKSQLDEARRKDEDLDRQLAEAKVNLRRAEETFADKNAIALALEAKEKDLLAKEKDLIDKGQDPANVLTAAEDRRLQQTKAARQVATTASGLVTEARDAITRLESNKVTAEKKVSVAMDATRTATQKVDSPATAVPTAPDGRPLDTPPQP